MLTLNFLNIEVNNTTHASATFLKGPASQRKKVTVLQSYGNNSEKIRRGVAHILNLFCFLRYEVNSYVRLQSRDETIYV